MASQTWNQSIEARRNRCEINGRREAIVTVIPSSRNIRPVMPPMTSRGLNTAISAAVMEMMVKVISPAPRSVASGLEHRDASLGTVGHGGGRLNRHEDLAGLLIGRYRVGARAGGDRRDQTVVQRIDHSERRAAFVGDGRRVVA